MSEKISGEEQRLMLEVGRQAAQLQIAETRVGAVFDLCSGADEMGYMTVKVSDIRRACAVVF